MSEPITHASFSVERTFPVAPARVFAAFADPDLKAAWFRGPHGWEATTRDPGLPRGRPRDDRRRGRPANGPAGSRRRTT